MPTKRKSARRSRTTNPLLSGRNNPNSKREGLGPSTNSLSKSWSSLLALFKENINSERGQNQGDSQEHHLVISFAAVAFIAARHVEGHGVLETAGAKGAAARTKGAKV